MRQRHTGSEWIIDEDARLLYAACRMSREAYRVQFLLRRRFRCRNFHRDDALRQGNVPGRCFVLDMPPQMKKILRGKLEVRRISNELGDDRRARWRPLQGGV